MPIDGGYHGIAQSLGGIGQRVEERDDLEPFDRVERTPGIVGAAGKDQRPEVRKIYALPDFLICMLQ